jgi:phosphoenolpyruvate-protein kinase (PTS system EI component)
LKFLLGGILSHGAVVAREFQIPAVLRVKEATLLIKTGQKITVNGKNGVVEISKE